MNCDCGKEAIVEMGGLWVCMTCARRKIYNKFSLLKHYHPIAKKG